MPPVEFSIRTRRDHLDRASRETWDILVIGGGVVGAGIARDAALRGYRTVLVERADFASGTSGRSGRQVHGGLRYLTTGQFRLIAESLSERATLRRIAPHLVTPAEYLFPVYGSVIYLGLATAGLAAYQSLAFGRVVSPLRTLNHARTIEVEPQVNGNGLAGGITYGDCLVDDARLVLAVIRDAHEHGAVVANHAEAAELLRTGDRVCGVAVRDTLTGRSVEVRSRVVINATGPWLDRITPPGASAPIRIRRSRGSHIVLPRSRLDIRRVVIFPSVQDRRRLYAIPWGTTVIVGTTEIEHPGDLEDVYATADEVAYLLDAVNAAFPNAGLQPDDIISTYASLRPLVDRRDMPTSRTPRDFAVVMDPAGLITVGGGKLTTFRLMAQHAVDAAARYLDPGPFRRCRTAELPLQADDAPSPSGIDGHEGIEARVVQAARHEMAVNLSDCLIRRLHLIHDLPDQGLGAAPALARVMAPLVGWTDAEIQAQVEQYQRDVGLTRRHHRS